MMPLPKAIVVGAGPVGCYAAARLIQSRLVSEVHVFEKQEKIDLVRSAGRNVNITLCKRGLDALKLVGLIPESKALPARQLTHFTVYTPKGQLRRSYYGDGLMSVKRNDLYHALHDKALSLGALFHFGVRFESVLSQTSTELAAMFVSKDGSCNTETCSILIGSDGVHSSVRKNIFENVVFSRYKNADSLNEVAEKYMDSCVVQEHELGYRELTVPPEIMQTATKLEMDTFHIWGDTGMIVLGLPSADGTLTIGVYMDKNKLRQFTTAQMIQKITDVFPDLTDLLSLMSKQQEEFHSYGSLHCVLSPYLGEGSIVLLGDAGHAMLPFLGQGLNSGLEDVCLLLECLEKQQDQSSGFIERAVRSFSIPRIDDIQTIVHQSFNECEKLQLLYKESEMVGKTEDSSIQPKSFFELISTTDIGYKKALELASSQNKDIGAAVKEGETLAVYQAVKTVMTVKSPCDGVITDIKSSVSGQPVYTIKPRSDAQLISTEGTVRMEEQSTAPVRSDQFDIAAVRSQLKTSYIGREFTYLESTGSTMDDAKSAARLGCASGSTFMAETMTKGRGRQGKVWTAPPRGNIYVTFVLRLPEKSSSIVQFAAALAVAKAVISEGLDAKVKWPNDIWVRGHKVSGILVEAETSAGVEENAMSTDKEKVKGNPNVSAETQPAVFYLGIGINVNDDSRRNQGLRKTATSISSELLGEKVARERVLANLCQELELALDRSMEAILNELEPILLLKRSSEVKISLKEEEAFAAEVEKIDNLGRLHIKRRGTNEAIILSDLMTSVRPSPVKDIYVYEGDGSSEQSVHMLYESLLAMCDLAKYNVKRITPEEIRQGSWVDSATLLAIGGGFDNGYLRALKTDGLQVIREYIHAGGRYLGICAGAYLACCEIEFDKGGDLEVCGPRSLEFFPGKCIGPTFPGFVYNSEAGSQAAEIKYMVDGLDAEPESSRTGFVYYNGGGHFELNNLQCESVQTISQLMNAPEGEIRTAAVKCQVGKGTAILSGVHFEYLVEDLNESDIHLKSVMPKLRDTVFERDRFYMSVMKMLGL